MITTEMLTPMLRMTDAEIDGLLLAGLYGISSRRRKRVMKEREYRREECYYGTYSEDWERESDD